MQIDGMLHFLGHNNKKRGLCMLSTVQNLPNTLELWLLKSTDGGFSDTQT